MWLSLHSTLRKDGAQVSDIEAGKCDLKANRGGIYNLPEEDQWQRRSKHTESES